MAVLQLRFEGSMDQELFSHLMEFILEEPAPLPQSSSCA